MQPPTTQALLKQQCHLVSFDGLSAIVGISSAKLQKLNQGKVPNIEAAFAQVCQRLVKVQLEVANPRDSLAKSTAASIKQPVVEAATSSPEQSFPQPLPNQVKTIQPEPESTQAPTASQEQTVPKVAANSTTISHRNSHNHNPPQAVTVSQDISVLTAPAIPIDNDLDDPVTSTAELDSNQNYVDSDLQQAIDNLTQSFEGEVVQLDNNSQAEFLAETELPKLTIDAAGLERPDIEDYDDDW